MWMYTDIPKHISQMSPFLPPLSPLLIQVIVLSQMTDLFQLCLGVYTP